jgi:hypothetical protein
MTIYLLEETLQIDVFYECEDHDLEDNICISVVENCPPAERIMRAGETVIYLTSNQARELGQALLEAVIHSEGNQAQ